MHRPSPETQPAEQRLQELRREVVDQLHAGDALTGREMLGCAVGGGLLFVGVVLTLVGLSDEAEGSTAAVAVVLGGLSLALAFLALRPWTRRRVEMVRTVRRLRREEKALAATLPPDRRGRSVWSTYYRERFASPLAVISVLGFGILTLVQILR